MSDVRSRYHHLYWNDDRPDEEFRNEGLSDMWNPTLLLGHGAVGNAVTIIQIFVKIRKPLPVRRLNREREHAELWHRLFQEHHSSLMLVARMILRDSGRCEAVLKRALAVLEESTCGEDSRRTAATRTVVKTAITFNSEAKEQAAPHEWGDPFVHGDLRESGIESLPWLERAVYFLRTNLLYSRRNTALLLRIGDSDVDQLLAFAQKRLS